MSSAVIQPERRQESEPYVELVRKPLPSWTERELREYRQALRDKLYSPQLDNQERKVLTQTASLLCAEQARRVRESVLEGVKRCETAAQFERLTKFLAQDPRELGFVGSLAVQRASDLLQQAGKERSEAEKLLRSALPKVERKEELLYIQRQLQGIELERSRESKEYSGRGIREVEQLVAQRAEKLGAVREIRFQREYGEYRQAILRGDTDEISAKGQMLALQALGVSSLSLDSRKGTLRATGKGAFGEDRAEYQPLSKESREEVTKAFTKLPPEKQLLVAELLNTAARANLVASQLGRNADAEQAAFLKRELLETLSNSLSKTPGKEAAQIHAKSDELNGLVRNHLTESRDPELLAGFKRFVESAQRGEIPEVAFWSIGGAALCVGAIALTTSNPVGWAALGAAASGGLALGNAARVGKNIIEDRERLLRPGATGYISTEEMLINAGATGLDGVAGFGAAKTAAGLLSHAAKLREVGKLLVQRELSEETLQALRAVSEEQLKISLEGVAPGELKRELPKRLKEFFDTQAQKIVDSGGVVANLGDLSMLGISVGGAAYNLLLNPEVQKLPPEQRAAATEAFRQQIKEMALLLASHTVITKGASGFAANKLREVSEPVSKMHLADAASAEPSRAAPSLGSLPLLSSPSLTFPDRSRFDPRPVLRKSEPHDPELTSPTTASDGLQALPPQRESPPYTVTLVRAPTMNDWIASSNKFSYRQWEPTEDVQTAFSSFTSWAMRPLRNAMEIVPIPAGLEKKAYIQGPDFLLTHEHRTEVLFVKQDQTPSLSQSISKAVQDYRYDTPLTEIANRDSVRLSDMPKGVRETVEGFLERNPEQRERMLRADQMDCIVTPELKSLFLLDFLSSREGKIRRSGKTYRSPEFDDKWVAQVAPMIRENKPVPIYLIALPPKIPSHQATAAAVLPDLGAIQGVANLNAIAETASTIHPIQISVHYEGDIFQKHIGFNSDDISAAKEAASSIFRAVDQEFGNQGRVNFIPNSPKLNEGDEHILRALSQSDRRTFDTDWELLRTRFSSLPSAPLQDRELVFEAAAANQHTLQQLRELKRNGSSEQSIDGALDRCISTLSWRSLFLEWTRKSTSWASESGKEPSGEGLKPVARVHDLTDRFFEFKSLSSFKYQFGPGGKGLQSVMGREPFIHATTAGENTDGNTRLALQFIPGALPPHRGVSVRSEKRSKWETRVERFEELFQDDVVSRPIIPRGQKEALYYERLSIISRNEQGERQIYTVRDEAGKMYEFHRSRTEFDRMGEEIDRLRALPSSPLVYARTLGAFAFDSKPDRDGKPVDPTHLRVIEYMVEKK